jgi:hypothetical protein
MHVPAIYDALQAADEKICEALEVSRSLTASSTYQGCAETNEAQACRLRADLADLRGRLVELQRQYLGI